MGRLRTGIAVLLLVWMTVNAQSIIIPFLIAFTLAYLINPLVDCLERIRVPRLLAVSLLFGISAGLIVLAWFTLIPDLIREIQDLIVRLPQIFKGVIAYAHEHLPKLFNLLNVDYLKIEQDFLQNQYPAKVESLLLQAVKALSGMGTLLSRVLNVILIPVLTFYFLKDYNKIKSGFLDFVPRKNRTLVNFYLYVQPHPRRIHQGKLITCVFVGLRGSGHLLDTYSIMIVETGILNSSRSPDLHQPRHCADSPRSCRILHAAIQVLIVFAVVQSIEGYVTPKIVERVGLHPVM
jgi:predicted PurR-regulated permease PerM